MSNTNKAVQPISVSAKKFFSSPSKLSTGGKNRRFKGTAKSNTFMKSCSDQSTGVATS